MDPSKDNSVIYRCFQCGSGLEKDSNNESCVRRYKRLYCRPCWVNHCDLRFRKRVLEISKTCRPTTFPLGFPEKLLVYYDGSPSSIALLNLIKATVVKRNDSVDQASNKRNTLKLPSSIYVFVITEMHLHENDELTDCERKREKHLNHLLCWLQENENLLSTPMKFFRFADYFAFLDTEVIQSIIKARTNPISSSSAAPLISEDEVVAQNKLKHLLNDFKSKNDAKSFSNILRTNLINKIAKIMNFSELLLPEEQTSLGIKMFTLMSLGRGSQLAEEMSFISLKDGVHMCRPLLDFSSDDVQDYLSSINLGDLNGWHHQRSHSRKMKIDSIERQCDDFVVNLQRDYPSTVSTLTRIGSKLTDMKKCDAYSHVCPFCKGSNLKEDSNKSISICHPCQNIVSTMKNPELFDIFISRYDISDP